MSQCKVLVIDDQESILEIFEYFLESEGYKVLAKPTTENIFDDIRLFKPSVILMDVILQQSENGIQVCQSLKQDSFLCHIPVILMSASRSMLLNFNNHQANAIIEKPFELDQVQDLIKKVIKEADIDCETKVKVH